jgi:hypothetical protein
VLGVCMAGSWKCLNADVVMTGGMIGHLHATDLVGACDVLIGISKEWLAISLDCSGWLRSLIGLLGLCGLQTRSPAQCYHAELALLNTTVSC